MQRRVIEITDSQAEELYKPENQDINFSGFVRKALDEELKRRKERKG